MITGTQYKTQGCSPGRRFVFDWASTAVLCLLVFLAPSSFAGPRAWVRQRAQAARPAPVRPAPARPEVRSAPRQNGNGNTNGAARPGGNTAGQGYAGNPAVMRPGVNGGARAGQPHLQEWMNQHQNLSPQQQENLLRHEPGFNRLSPDQQQRVLNRFRSLEARPPEQQQRMLGRNEMFERLTPGQKADVRTSAEAMRSMPANRQALVRRAFNDLRQIPPDQRQ
jgi:hypothetical protein